MAEKRRVLVTGSSRGIGRAVAVRLAHDGFEVTVHGRASGPALAEAEAEVRALGVEARAVFFDVADRDAARAALEAELERAGAFYGVVSNAGIAIDAPFPGIEAADWDMLVGTNLNGLYNVLHPLVMPMIQLRNGGRIVTISSLSGVTGNRGQVGYSATKAGIIGATKSLAKELAKRRISVNCVAPGFIETDMTGSIPAEEVRRAVPMQRAGRPEEVAGLVSYLFSAEAEYVTGQVVSINGGLA